MAARKTATPKAACLVRVGYYEVVVKDIQTATKLVEMLSEAVISSDHSFYGDRPFVEIDDESLKVEMKVVPRGCIVRHKGDPLALEHKA